MDGEHAAGDDGDHQRHLGQLGEHRLEACGEFRRPHFYRVKVATKVVELVDLALFLSERLDHAHAGDGLFDVLCKFCGGVLVDPRCCVERFARPVGLPKEHRQQCQRHRGQCDVHAQHDDQGGYQLHDAREHHRQGVQDRLVHVQIRDRARDNLAGHDLVLSRPVQAVQCAQDLGAQPVLRGRCKATGGGAPDDAQDVGGRCDCHHQPCHAGNGTVRIPGGNINRLASKSGLGHAGERRQDGSGERDGGRRAVRLERLGKKWASGPHVPCRCCPSRYCPYRRGRSSKSMQRIPSG